MINKWDTVPDKDGSTMSQYEKVRRDGLSRSILSQLTANSRPLGACIWFLAFIRLTHKRRGPGPPPRRTSG